ncbi:MAG: nucleoside deaminase [Proteobacteria bacterium]|nr:nucleoside deaminase [Pseudomonadota bacterium]
MRQALGLAEAAAKRDEVPVGAVIVDKNGKVIAAASNRVEEWCDPSAHAEVVAIREACRALGTTKLVECDMYVSLEPCTMCAQAISFARIRRLYYGASDPKMGGIEQGSKVFMSSTCHHKPEVYGGIMAAPSEALMKAFFQAKRS